MADKNFIVKNGLEVGGQEVVSSSGVVTSAALGGQTLASTDSPTFNNLTLTNDIAVGGDINLTGDLNITGDVNSLSVTDLDVTDQTITLGAGQVESASGGSGIVVDGSGASILWDETNSEWDFNKSINVTGTITASGNITGTLATAAQPNITSLGTLTTLTVDDIIIDGSGIKASRIGRSTTDTAQANINFWDYNHASYPGHVHIVANSTGSDGSTHDSGEIKFWVNSGSFVQTMTIDKAGSVGIGTNSPTSWASYTDSAATVLQVFDSSERARVVINGGNGAHLDLVDYVGATNDKHMNIAVDGGILKFGSLNDAGNAFVQNNIMIMDLGTGNVSIGTTNTTEKLQVKGGLGLEASNSTNRWSAYTYTDNTFRLNYNGSGDDEFLIDSSGKVGIGTSSPKTYLHIGPLSGGDGTAQERLRISGDFTATGSGSLIRFTNQHNSGSNPNSGEYNIAGIKAFDFRSDWGGALALQTAPNTNTGGNLTDRLVIDPEGKIGIGNSTPGSNHAKANNLVVGSGSAGGIAVYNGLNEGWYAFSRDNANNTDAYDGGMSYDGDRNLRLHTNAGSERLKIGGDGLATFTSTRSEWAMRLNTAGGRAGIVFDKPGTTTIMGSALMLSSDETFRLGTASYYHVRMDQSGNTYMGNSGTTRFGSTGNLSVNTTTMNSGITSGTDVRALGPCFANDANSFTMSQEGTGNADAYLAARGPNSSTRGNIHIGVSVSGGGGFKSGLVVDNQGRSTTPENPAFRARGTSAQTLGSGWQIVGYNSLYDQTGSAYSTTNSRFTAPVAGWYQFNAAWTANNNSDADGTLAIWINGSSTDLVSSTSMPNTGGNYDGHFCSGVCYLDVNDYVDVHRYSTVSTTTRSSQSYGGWFSGILIG